MIVMAYIQKISVLFCLLGFACFGGSSSKTFSTSDIKTQLPQGKMSGTEWTMVDAMVRVDSFESDQLSVNLYPSDIEDCGFGVSSEGGEIIFSVPRMEGEYPFLLDFSSKSQTATFVPAPGENVISTEGLIVIEHLSESEVTMGIVAQAGNSKVNGRFTATICP